MGLLLQEDVLQAAEALLTRGTVAKQSGTNPVTNTSTSLRTSVTQSFTVGAGANTLMIVHAGTEGNNSVPTSVTYGGVALRPLPPVRSATFGTASFWYLFSPTAGTANVVTANPNDRIAIAIYLFEDVEQDPFKAFTAIELGIGTGGTSASLTVKGITDAHYVISGFDIDGSGHSVLPGATEEYDIELDSGAHTMVGSTQPGSSGSVMSYGWTTGNPWQHVAFGILAAEAAGNVDIPGLDSAAAFGTPSFNVTADIPGLGSAAAFGTASFQVTVDIPGLDSAAAFGTPAFVVSFTVPGLDTAADFGVPTFTTGNVDVAITGLGSVADFGAVSFLPGPVSISPVGLDSAADFGTPTFTSGTNVDIPGLDTAAVFGTVGLNPGGVSVNITGLDTAAEFGVPSVTTPAGGQSINPVGLDSVAAFGAVTFSMGGVNVTITALDSAAAFGSVGVTTPGGESALDPSRRGYYF